MFDILTLNKIAKCGLDKLGANFAVSDSCADPDGIILRSFSLHEMELGDNLKCVARAGAGVNNIPIEKCSEKGIGTTVPIDTGKHIYTNWTQIMEKRGALHPAMDPFLMKENQGLQMNYTMDMCPKSLDLLSRTLYVGINPEWTETDIANIAAVMNG